MYNRQRSNTQLGIVRWGLNACAAFGAPKLSIRGMHEYEHTLLLPGTTRRMLLRRWKLLQVTLLCAGIWNNCYIDNVSRQL